MGYNKRKTFSSGGRAARRSRPRRLPRGKLLLASITFCNLLMTIILSLFRRREIIKAVRGENGQVTVLLSTEPETRVVKKT